MIVHILWFVVLGVAAPYLLGALAVRLLKKDWTGICVRLVGGYIVLWGVFEAVVWPCLLFKTSLKLLEIVYAVIILALAGVSVFVNKKDLLIPLRPHIRKEKIMLYVAMALVAAQTVFVASHQHIDDDDAFFVATAETAVATDTLMEYNPSTGEPYRKLPARYVLSPFPVWNAAVSGYTGLKPVVTAHTGMPLLFLPLAYMVYYLCGKWLARFRKLDVGVFLLFVNVVFLFSGYSIYSQGTFLLTRIWQGKAVLAAVLLPAVLAFFLALEEEKPPKRNFVFFLLLMLSCCLASSMGIILGAAALLLLAAVDFFRYKRWKNVAGYLFSCLPNFICAAVFLAMR